MASFEAMNYFGLDEPFAEFETNLENLSIFFFVKRI